MKTIGLIGGTSWVSTIDYYKLMNQLTNDLLGSSNAARIILYSVNFEEFKSLLDAENWTEIAERFSEIAKKLQVAGADCIVIGANTPHLIADQILETVPLPLIHVAEETGKEIAKHNMKKVALLGTKFVMDRGFYKEKLSQFGVETILPAPVDKDFIHDSIFTEFSRGIFTRATADKYLEIIEHVIQQGAEGIVYACTEIPILLRGHEVKVPTFDTTLIHTRAAVAFATEN